MNRSKLAVFTYLLASLTFSTSSTSWASSEKIKLDVTFKKGTDTASVKIDGHADEITSVTKSSYRFEVKPKFVNTENGKAVRAEFKVFHIVNQKEELVMAPAFIVLNNSPAIMTVTDSKDRKNKVSLKVIPHFEL